MTTGEAHSTPRAGPRADAGRSLRFNVVYAVLGMGTYSAAQLAVTMLLAKFAGATVLGQYFYALALSTPIILLLGLELRAVFVADVRNEFTFGTYAALRGAGMTLAAAILAGALAVEAVRGASGGTLAFLAGVFAGKLLWARSELSWGIFNRRERLDHLGAAAALRGITLVGAYAIVLPLAAKSAGDGASTADDSAMAGPAAIAAWLSVLAWLAIDVLHDHPRLRRHDDRTSGWTRADLWRLARRAAPLGLVAAAVNLNDGVPRLVLEYSGHTAALGYFGALYALTLVSQLVVVQMSNASSNRLSLYFQEDRAAFARLMVRLCAAALLIGGAMAAVVFVCGEWLLARLYRPEYAAYAFELRIVMLAQCLALLTAVWGIACTQMRVYWGQVPAQAATLLTTAAFALWLIPADPVRGAAWTAVARAVVQFVAYGLCLWVGCSGAGRVANSK
jgi:O-antigen/teichoic acid export membrane protein